MTIIQYDATDRSVSGPSQQEDTPDLAMPQHRSYLHSLPSELFDLILAYLNRFNIIALGQSCKALYHMLLRNVYREVFVGHGGAQTARAAHRLLTIKQKRKLATESTFKYQERERYCTGVNDDIKPKCTEFVRKLHIEMPAKRFGHIITRYIEELLQNLDNVEILITSLMSP
jgi:hypothetical protein